MHVFEVVIALLLLGAALTAVAKRIGVPYPALVAIAGAGLALVPGTPTLMLDPNLALALFVAPVLLDSAFDSPARDLRTDWKAIASLAIGAVVLTVAVVAVVTRLLVPTMPWYVAIALGAIVAPPDAAAASAVLRQLRLPHRLLVILEGESLFNDASALLIYRLAVGMALAGVLSPVRALATLLLVTGGSVVLGLVLSRVLFFFNARIRDVGVGVVVQFCGTFAVWIIADRLQLSGILTLVVFAMATSPMAAKQVPGSVRIPSYAVWEFAVFVLNVLAFILVGFQLKAILQRIDRSTLFAYAGIAAAVCVATVVARFVYVGVAMAIEALVQRGSRGDEGPTSRTALVMGWSGMRGIVTLAAALALPTSNAQGAPFPHRDLIVFCAFSVVLVTLVVQGMTLGPLIRRLRLPEDGSIEREVRMARVETAEAALKALAELPSDELSDILRRRFRLLVAREQGALDAAQHGSATGADASNDDAAAIVRATTGAEREKLLALRAAGTIGAEAFQLLEQELDREEIYLQQIAGAPEA